MATWSKSASKPFEWTTLLYILLILVFPLVLMSTVQAQGSSASNTSREDLGDGKPAQSVSCTRSDPVDVLLVIGIDLGMFQRVTQ